YVLPDWAGKIWIAYAGGGIIAFDRTTERITDVLGGAGLPQFAASSRLYVGRDGAAWLLSHTGIRTIRSDRGQWIEARVPGAELIGPAFSVFQDRDRKLWFATRRGLVYHDGQRFSNPLKPPPEVESTYRALQFPGFAQRNQPVLMPLEGESRAVSEAGAGLQDADGRIWLPAARAVVTLDVRPNKWEVLELPTGFPGCDLLCEGKHGIMWFAGSSGQLAAYERGRRRWSMVDLLTHVPSAQPDDILSQALLVNGIHLDSSGTMMVATSRG